MTDRPPLLPTYSDYKPSGIPWLDEIPAHWETRRLKFSAANVTQMTSQRNEDDLTLALENVESWSGKYTDAGPDVHFDSKLKRFQARDVLFGKLRPYLAKVVLPDRNGLCVGEFLVLRARENVVLPEYLWMLLRSPTVIDIISGSSFGAKMPRADWRFIGGMRLPHPPPEEQAAIARYLTHKDALIQHFLQGKQRMLDLLKQLRKSTIHYAVIHGLDPKNTPMKPSGIPWLGDIPAHWETRRLKYVATTIMGQSPPSADCSDKLIGLPFLQGCAEFGAHHPTPVQYCRKPPKTSPPGAILLSVRAPVGRLNTADQEYGIGRGLCAIIPKNEILNTTLARYQLEALQHGLKLASTGSIYDAVRLYDVRSQRLLLPPLEEQAAIAEYLDDKVAKIEAAIAVTIRIIDQMRQYRKSLIHEVVTGVRDVRKAAAAIPADPPPPAPPTS